LGSVRSGIQFSALSSLAGASARPGIPKTKSAWFCFALFRWFVLGSFGTFCPVKMGCFVNRPILTLFFFRLSGLGFGVESWLAPVIALFLNGF